MSEAQMGWGAGILGLPEDSFWCCIIPDKPGWVFPLQLFPVHPALIPATVSDFTFSPCSHAVGHGGGDAMGLCLMAHTRLQSSDVWLWGCFLESHTGDAVPQTEPWVGGGCCWGCFRAGGKPSIPRRH